MRLVLLFIFACIVGIAVGIGSVNVVHNTWKWNPELEVKHAAQAKRAEQLLNLNPNAKIEIEESVFDFGIMDKKEKGQHSFTVRNIGSAELTLEKNATTCQCTGLDISPKRVPPGGKAIVTLHWNAERATESFKQSASVLTNDAENPEVYFTIQGLFIFPVLVAPNLITFPSVNPKVGAEATARIYGFEKHPLKITEAFWDDKEHFDIFFSDGELSEDDKGHAVRQKANNVIDAKITVKQGLPFGSFMQKFVLKTNYESAPSEELSVRGQISSGAVTISGRGYNRNKGFLDLGTRSRGEKYEQTLSVGFTGAKASIEISEVRPKWLIVELQDEKEAGEGELAKRFFTLGITIPAGSPVGTHDVGDETSSGWIVLKTSHPDIPMFRIPVQLNIVP